MTFGRVKDGVQVAKRHPVERSWKGGPLREVKRGLGRYVCDICQKPVVGVYMTDKGWVCGGCKGKK